jgi:WD40 repeat protein
MDVLDLDWQRLVVDHQSSYTLASASIDNLIIIWTISCPHDAISRTSSLVSPSKILKGHDSYVKGLAFDPLGR